MSNANALRDIRDKAALIAIDDTEIAFGASDGYCFWGTKSGVWLMNIPFANRTDSHRVAALLCAIDELEGI